MSTVKSTAPLVAIDESTVVTFALEVNRADLEHNSVSPPERWSLEDAAEADRLGLVYAFEVTVRDGGVR